MQRKSLDHPEERVQEAVHSRQIFIDSSKQLQTECELVLQSSSVVGIDAEWPPFDSCGPPKACLLQLACLVIQDRHGEYRGSATRYVYVIDIHSVCKEGDSGYKLVKDIFRALLKNIACLKIGHSLDADIKAVCCALDLPIQGVVVTNAVDVKHLFSRLWHKRVPGLYGTCRDKGLSFILNAVLGVMLDKSLQCSDWGQRPLTDEQILYAANDASCLLDLFMAACTMCDGNAAVQLDDDKYYCLSRIAAVSPVHVNLVRRCVVDFGQEWTWNRHSKLVTSRSTEFWKTQQSVRVQNRKSRSQRKKTGMVHEGELPKYIPWDVQKDEPKFICDVMLQGLAKQLRLWGVDCEMAPILSKAERYLAHRRLVETGQEQGRVILTKDTVLYSRRISDQMYLVAGETKQEQTEEVLKTFTVQVGPDSFMTRCSACNGSFHSEPRRPDQLPSGHALPDAVLEHIHEFWVCSVCDSHIYWKGGQYQRSMEKLNQDFEKMFSIKVKK